MIELTGAYANYFEKVNNDRWRLKGKNIGMEGAILKFYRSLHGPGFTPLSILGLPQTNSITHPRSTKQKPIYIKVFQRGVVAYDPGHVLDSPSGAGECYLLHHDSPVLLEIADQLFLAAV